MTDKTLKDYEKIALVQHHQLNSGNSALQFSEKKLNEIKEIQRNYQNLSKDFDNEAEECMALLESLDPAIARITDDFPNINTLEEFTNSPNISALETLTTGSNLSKKRIDTHNEFESIKNSLATVGTEGNFLLNIERYADIFHVNVERSAFLTILSPNERKDFWNKFENELIYKKAKCDKYDYMISGTCGLLGGLIDAFFVGAPNTDTLLGNWSDDLVDQSVVKFSKYMGWSGNEKSNNAVKNAITYLENKYKVNYDQQYGPAANNLLDMSTRNHHLKSIAHWPDIIGLFFSILDQFNSTSHFLDNGRLITFDTSLNQLKLQGGNFPAKLFCGFVNWFGHIMSDIAGSSHASGRGSGVSIPFYGLFLLCDFGSIVIEDEKKTIADIAVKIFEQGYDTRHAIAMSIPVLITEFLIRFMWSMKAHFYHNKNWKDCIPSDNIPELRRMLTVGYGVFCAIDGIDATIRGGGEVITTLLRMNLFAWVRFVFLSIKEIQAFCMAGHIDDKNFSIYIEKEYQMLLEG